MLLTQILSSMTVMVCMLIDSIMIGRFLGVDSLSAYGLASPVLLVFAAFGNLISAGVQVVCGKTMGSGDRKGTNACFSVSVVLAAVISVVGVILILVFTDPICTILGAGRPHPDNPVFFLTRDYLRGFIIGAPAFISAQIMVPYMQLSGNRTRLVIAVAMMTVGDIVFDALNVLVFHGGTLGMGLASSVSYYIAFVIGAAYFLKKSCLFRFRKKLLKRSVSRQLIMAGVPTLINQLSLVLLTFVLNNILLGVGGNLAVAAYSVITSAGNICYSFSSGIGSVALMLSSIFYTDKDKNALNTVVSAMCFFSVLICGIVTIGVTFGAKWLVALFLENRAAERLAVWGMRLFVMSLVPCALNTCFKNYYQGIDRIRLTEVISVLQNFLLPATAAFVLSRFLKITGVWLGFLSGELLTLVFITLYVTRVNKRFSITAEAFSLLGDDFGVGADNCFEMSFMRAEDVSRCAAAAQEFCRSHGLDENRCSLTALCIEEMTKNAVRSGLMKNDGEHNVDVRILIKDGEPTLRIRDNCEHFDPVKYLELHSSEIPEEHKGIRAVLGRVTTVNYVNTLGFNNLTLTM